LENWDFHWGPPLDISGDSTSFTDEDRRQWRLRLPGYLVANHLTAEPEFISMVARVRCSPSPAGAAWAEAACFSPRGGQKGGRRTLMAGLLEVAADAPAGDEERALQRRLSLSRAWAGPEEQSGRRTAYQSQDRYIARLWIGARVLVCRSAGRCVECEIANGATVPAHSGDYCRGHLSDVDHERLAPAERARRKALRSSKGRHRKAIEHLFLDLEEIVGQARDLGLIRPA
jgi:hypothetical protein